MHNAPVCSLAERQNSHLHCILFTDFHPGLRTTFFLTQWLTPWTDLVNVEHMGNRWQDAMLHSQITCLKSGACVNTFSPMTFCPFTSTIWCSISNPFRAADESLTIAVILFSLNTNPTVPALSFCSVIVLSNGLLNKHYDNITTTWLTPLYPGEPG